MPMIEPSKIEDAPEDRSDGPERARAPLVVAIGILVAGACFAVLLARAQVGAERDRWFDRSRMWADNLARTITLIVREDTELLRRMAARLAEDEAVSLDAWRNDARLYLAHESSYIALALVDGDERVLAMVTDGKTSEGEVAGWMRPPDRPDFRVAELRLGEVRNRAPGVEVLPGWIVVDSPAFGKIRLVNGWDVDRLIETALTQSNFPLRQFETEIRVNGRLVFASAGATEAQQPLAAAATISADTEDAEIRVWPSQPVGVPPGAWLTAGAVVLIALLLGLVSYTAWRALSDRARLAAREAELREQVAARTQAETRLRALADRLDAKVAERTRDLEQTTAQLHESREEALRLMESARRTGRLAEQHSIELARSNQNLELFMRVASHDMKEPLRMVRSYTDLLHDRYGTRLDEQAREFLSYAKEGAERMQRMLEDVLILCRIQLDSLDLPVTDAVECLQNACANLSLLMQETGAVVREEQLLPVRADRSLLTLLFQNLIGNAIKFHGEESPVIAINMREDGERVRTEVRDNGIGIAPCYHARVFEPFQRLQTRDQREGSGVGLAICRRIVEWHGGAIGIHSTEGEGATIWFTLPAADDHDE